MYILAINWNSFLSDVQWRVYFLIVSIEGASILCCCNLFYSNQSSCFREQLYFVLAYHASIEMLATCSIIVYHLVDFDGKRTFSIKEKFVAESEENLDMLDLQDLLFLRGVWHRLSKISARDQGATYPRVESSFLFQLQRGQTRIPSWWKRTWKMEDRIRKDQELFLQYEVNHLYHWYGLSLSFLHLSKT